MTDTIESFMQRQVWTVGPDETLAAIESQMTARNLVWAPVADPDGGVIGVISASDLLRFRAEEKNPATCAWQLCTYKPITVLPEATVRDVAQQMLDTGVHHVLVASSRGAMLGVVSSLDVVRALLV